jgi:hypothetical protein
MPVTKCPNGKYRIGSGPCMYTSEEKAQRAYVAYLAKKAPSRTRKPRPALRGGKAPSAKARIPRGH